jgi:hypothetical protein
MQITNRLALVLVLDTFLVAGCGGPSGPTTYGVSGKVVWNGEPLPEGAIEFLPMDSAGAKYSRTGALVSEGRYSVQRRYGLIPGRYRVRIQVDEKGDVPDADLAKPGATPRIPRKYNMETILSVEITPSGSNTFDFRLD